MSRGILKPMISGIPFLNQTVKSFGLRGLLGRCDKRTKKAQLGLHKVLFGPCCGMGGCIKVGTLPRGSQVVPFWL